MTLRKKQSKFAYMLAELILYEYWVGYEVTIEPDVDGEGHMDNSLHYIKLAKDINLFKDDVYLTTTEDHKVLGEYRESIGGSWGGRFNDGNHYSLEHGGRK